ncbi:MAG: hypothetical protein D3921_13050 [Candidatus Electrothrix sp. AW1]|nr:hypothetical protein [Candidatus Electrothrix gigas]MCI5226717.1 hypothetical protein [Candidatus Electrothrix gigas]
MADFAVFTRNYREHIVAAGERERGVFRSKVRWSTPERALKEGDTIDVYIALADGNRSGYIEFRAKLSKIILNPNHNDPDVIEMLKNTPSSTEGEELWEGNVETLYELTNIEKVEPPFPFTELRKLNGGENIDSNYSRSYCIVQAID